MSLELMAVFIRWLTNVVPCNTINGMCCLRAKTVVFQQRFNRPKFCTMNLHKRGAASRSCRKLLCLRDVGTYLDDRQQRVLSGTLCGSAVTAVYNWCQSDWTPSYLILRVNFELAEGDSKIFKVRHSVLKEDIFYLILSQDLLVEERRKASFLRVCCPLQLASRVPGPNFHKERFAELLNSLKESGPRSSGRTEANQ